jgi:protein dithiol:quinone oxidoreductase
MVITNRLIYLSIFLACAGLMAFGLYLQHVEGLVPCPLCIMQRVAFIVVGVLALIAALHNPQRAGGLVYGALTLIASLAGLGVAARHIWVQNLPPEQLASCGPGVGYLIDSLGLAKALPLIFKGEGECAMESWKFLGLSIPAWSLVWFVLFALAAVWLLLRASRPSTRKYFA